MKTHKTYAYVPLQKPFEIPIEFFSVSFNN